MIPIRLLLAGIVVVLSGISGPLLVRAAEQVDLLQEIASQRDEVINRGMISFNGAGYILVEGSFHVGGSQTEQCVKLWRTNGAAGTAVVKSLCDTDGNSSYTSYPLPKRTWDVARSPNPSNEPVVLGNSFFFTVIEIDPAYVYRIFLWKSDGTAEGTVKVREIDSPVNFDLRNAICVMDDALYFLAGESLWRSDGTGPGTWKVLDLNFPQTLLAYKDRLYIHVYNFAEGRGEILVSNGTAGGTRVFLPDIGPFDPRMTVHGDELYFLADDNIHGQELWKTDGTYPGTRLVADINPGPYGSDITNLIPLNGRLLFWANDFFLGTELWRTDGTREGTTRVKDIAPGAQGTNNFHLLNAAMNNELYFNIQIGTSNVHQLWKTNGQESGTVLIRDNLVSPTYSFHASLPIVPTDSAILENKLYFRASTVLSEYLNMELWTTDGTAQGTYQVKDNAPGTHPNSSDGLDSSPSDFITIDNGIVFLANYDYQTNVPDEYPVSRLGLFGVQQHRTGSSAPALPAIIQLLLTSTE